MQYLQAAKKVRHWKNDDVMMMSCSRQAKKKDEVAMLKQQLADLDAFRSELSSSA